MERMDSVSEFTDLPESFPWRHSLTYREYEASNYFIKTMNVGLDYTTTVPQAPIQLAVGAELGTGIFHHKITNT